MALTHYDKDRIGLEDSPMSAAIKLADGNPGAITAICKLMQDAPAIDPDSVWGSYGPLLSLDSHRIYGSHVWLLWKDVCEQSALKAETLFRAAQLGIMRGSLITEAARTGRHEFDFDALLASVQERLPAFGRLSAA